MKKNKQSSTLDRAFCLQKRGRRFWSKKGFTGVEIAVVVSLISLMSIILADIFLAHSKFYNTESTKADLQLQGARLGNTLEKMLGVTSRVVETKTINSKSYTTSSQTIILELPSVNSEGKVITGSYDYAVFYLDSLNNKKFMLSIEANPLSNRASFRKLLSDMNDRLKFVYDRKIFSDARAVLVELTLSKNILNKKQSFNLNKKINLGNKP